MDTNEIRMWLLNDEHFYRLACSCDSWTTMREQLDASGIDAIGDLSIFSGDIDSCELDAEWRDLFPASDAR